MSEHTPVKPFDVSDENPKVIAEHMRALQREMRSGFELLAQKLLTAIERTNDKLDDLADWKAEVTRWQERTEARLAALEQKKRPRRGKVKK